MSPVHRYVARDSIARAVCAATACVLCLGSLSAAEPPAHDEAPPKHRFYAGAAVASLVFDDHYGGVSFNDSSVGTALFGGAFLNDHLSLELSYDSFDAIDLRDLAGSGVTRFDVKTRRRTGALSVVREVSLRDVFDWRRDWRVFGMAGVYRSNVERAVTVHGTNESSSTADEFNGVLLGAGVQYRLGGIDLRGYVRSFGVMNEREAREIGVTVHRRF
jgi:opacity protein-like surface antigen